MRERFIRSFARMRTSYRGCNRFTIKHQKTSQAHFVLERMRPASSCNRLTLFGISTILFLTDAYQLYVPREDMTTSRFSTNPHSPKEQFVGQLSTTRNSAAAAGLAAFALTATLHRKRVNAIGQLFELRNQSMVLQNVCLRVLDPRPDFNALSALTAGRCKILHTKETALKVGFGPDEYQMPPDFHSGVSAFDRYGGHATITLKPFQQGVSANTKLDEYRWGSGLQYIKLGVEPIRISKAIAAGAIVKSGYGWLDLVSPGGIPFQVVVGAPRDPLMLVCLRVSSVADSVRFFTQKLGMRVLPFPLSRAPGSPFEPLPPAGAVFVSYGVDTMGLLLVPADKNTGPVEIGNVLERFLIVVDDAARDLPEYVAEQMSAARQLGRGGSRDGSARLSAKAPAEVPSAVVHSPDGYPFTLLQFSESSIETRKA